MSEYDFAIFQTQSLHDEEGDEPMGRVRDYLMAMFERHFRGDDIDIRVVDDMPPSDYPDPPSEKTIDDWTDEFHDMKGEGKTYGVKRRLDYWFAFWIQCNAPAKMGADCTLLLTNESGAGLTLDWPSDTGVSYSVANAESVADCSRDFERYGTGKPHDDMQTVMHEVGHALLRGNLGNHHTTGEVTRDDWFYHYVTPLGMNGTENTTNYCEQSYERSGERRWDLVLSPNCARRHWKEGRERPTPTIDVSPGRPVAGDDITLDGTGSEDPDGSIRRYEWTVELGEETTAKREGESVTLQIDRPGRYDVTLTVTGDDRVSSAVTERMKVAPSTEEQNDPPVARIDGPEGEVYASETVSFEADASSDDGVIESYDWRIRRGGEVIESKSDDSFEHEFSEEGRYYVELVVEDGFGATDSAGTVLWVNEEPFEQP